MINELREAGLLTGSEPHLTDKGRDWLRLLEDTATEEVLIQNAASEWSEDLILSINAISR